MKKDEQQMTYETPEMEVIEYEAEIMATSDCPLKNEEGTDDCPEDSF